MADVTLTYKGSTIAEMSDTGSKTLKTAGKYCEGDIGVSYVKPSSGGSDELVKQLVQDRSRTVTITIPSDIGITKIAKYAFAYSSYNKINLPEGVTEIDNYAFYECSQIPTIVLPQSITKIGVYAFGFCENLRRITFPQNLETIQSSAFSNCKLLSSVTFKGTPTTINSTAFGSCTNLTTINVPWAEGAVANAPWGATNATINYNYTE